MENVPLLVSKKFMKDWIKINTILEEMNYKNYAENLNAKDFGVAQNRNRIFMVSILGDYNFIFPKGRPLEKTLTDYLEEDVDEKFYLSQKRFKNEIGKNYIKLPEATIKGYVLAKFGDGVYTNRISTKRGVVQKGMIPTIKTKVDDIGVVVSDNRTLKEKLADDLVHSGILNGGEVVNHSFTNSKKKLNSRITYDDYIESVNGISPTITTRGDTLGFVEKIQYNDKRLNAMIPLIKDNDTKIIDVYNKTFHKELSPTVIANFNQSNKFFLHELLRIRKLTPLETWRLMGISDEDFYKAKNAGLSNAQLYKQAGNGIVINVFEAILRKLIKGEIK
ncbi:MAG: DNA cytosine methyltransferase [Bacilli bacterium]|nr:DNA cytosine methyltransferase [Bacilli bacterium]